MIRDCTGDDPEVWNNGWINDVERAAYDSRYSPLAPTDTSESEAIIDFTTAPKNVDPENYRRTLVREALAALDSSFVIKYDELLYPDTLTGISA
jgi:hypothetical protein